MGIIYEFKDCTIHFDGNKLPTLNLSIEEGNKIALILEKDIYDIAILFFLFFLKNDYEGIANYKNKPIRALSPIETDEIIKKQSHLSPHLPLINNLKLIENIYIQKLYHTKESEKKLFEEAYEILKIFGIEDKFNYLPAFLTNYEKKCGLFARAMMSNTDVIYYSYILEDTDQDKKMFLLNLIEKFHNMKKGRITIITFKNKNNVPNNFQFDKIINL
jgi:ABC-type lipoprotein export system ATPase subunit